MNGSSSRVDEPAEILLARHAQTAWHAPNRYTGRTDQDIDDVGLTQARGLGDWSRTAALTLLVSSPQLRARRTIAPVAEATALPVAVHPALREIDFGEAEGLTMAELVEQVPDAAARFLKDPVAGHWPGGDDPAERALEAEHDLATLAASHPGARILVVAHSTLIRLVLCRMLGISISRYRTALGRPAPTSITHVRWTGRSTPVVVAMNVAPHAPPRAPDVETTVPGARHPARW